MSKPDYNQTAEDHASLLVIVRPIGSSIKQRVFNRLFDRISHLNAFNVAKPLRNINFKYKKSYTRDENLWGNFQAHRKVLGLITIGKCNDENYDDDGDGQPSDDAVANQVKKPNHLVGETKSELVAMHQKTAELFEDTLLDSILIILDSKYVSGRESTPDTPDGLPSPTVAPPDSSAEKLNGENGIKLNPDGSIYFGATNNELDPVQKESKNAKLANGEMPTSHVWLFRSDTDFDHDVLEYRMQDFFNSLFWVLESKRMDRSHERNENLFLLVAPPEKESAQSVDVESRAYKRRCLGRYRKHLGDLSLLAGIPGEASLHYQTCLDTLKTTNDWLWIAGAQEGLAVASYLILKPKSARSPCSPVSRNFSFSVKRHPSKTRGDASLKFSVNSAAASSLQSGLDLANNRVATSATFESLHEDILTNYKEAVVNYSKVKEACIIEMESSLKACRILAMYNRTIDASEFLQNVIKINPQISDEEKIEQFSTLSGLYSQLGLHRKSAFYSRIAAMVCVAPSSKKESWTQCYQLLLRSLPGFRLSLDYRDFIDSPESPSGWPSVRLRVMHELVYSTRRLGSFSVSVRHLCLLLHSMFEHLNPTERVELCRILQSYSVKCQPTPYSMALEDGTILPPVPLTKIPIMRSFVVSELAPSYRPEKFKKDSLSQDLADKKKASHHPFIYSPFIIEASNSSGKSNSQKNGEVTWVEGNTGEVCFVFKNTLPVELNVVDLDLIVEGLEVKVQPTNFTLPADCDDVKVSVPIVACSVGKMNIIGYMAEVFGIKSIIKFKEVLQQHKKLSANSQMLVEEKYAVKVVPAMPLLQLSVASSLMLDKDSTGHPSIGQSAKGSCAVSGSMVMYAGQRHAFTVTLLNIGSIPVESMEFIRSSDDLNEGLLSSLITCSNETAFKSNLPIEPGHKLELEFIIEGIFNFLTPRDSPRSDDVWDFPARNTSWGFPGCVDASCAGSVKVGSKNPRGMQCDEEILSKREKFSRLLSKHVNPGGTLKSEISLLFQYNGGAGKEFCRECSVCIPLFILPSISILQWKVLPGESRDEVTLSLKLKNSSELSVELHLETDTSDVVTVEPYQDIWFNCTLATMSNDYVATRSDSSLAGFDFLGFHHEEYRERLVAHLKKNLNLTWKMPAVTAEGSLSLEDIPFSPLECSLIQRPLISLDVSIGGGLPLCTRSTCVVGVLECAEVKICLRNETDFDWHELEISVSLEDASQKAESDTIDESPFHLIGSSRVTRQLLRVGETTSHSFAAVSAATGTTRLFLVCRSTSHEEFFRRVERKEDQFHSIYTDPTPTENHSQTSPSSSWSASFATPSNGEIPTVRRVLSSDVELADETMTCSAPIPDVDLAVGGDLTSIEVGSGSFDEINAATNCDKEAFQVGADSSSSTRSTGADPTPLDATAAGESVTSSDATADRFQILSHEVAATTLSTNSQMMINPSSDSLQSQQPIATFHRWLHEITLVSKFTGEDCQYEPEAVSRL